MNEITGDKDFVLALLRDTARNLAVRHPEVQAADIKKAFKATTDDQKLERDQLVERLQRAYEQAQMHAAANDALSAKEDAKKGAKKGAAGAKAMKVTTGMVSAAVQDVWYAPRDRTIALLQAAMDEYINQQTGAGAEAAEAKGIKAGTGAKQKKLSKTAAKNIFYKKASKQKGVAEAKFFIGEQFDNLDTGWAEWAIEKLKTAFKGKHPFIRHKALTDFRYGMNNKLTVALLADWGGGNDHAQAVANEVRKRSPDIVIHLGDVYYAGTEAEVRDRFLKFWPGSLERGRSFALNSNHEMYSGGYPYFDITLKEFKQDASYFCLENDNWRLIALDTGYVEHDLTQDQIEWLGALLNDGSNKTNILISHHQLYSAYETSPMETAGEQRLYGWLKGFLQAGLIPHWFWGHEHVCVIYQKFQGVKGRCIGHGCFPYNVPSATPPLNGPKDPKVEKPIRTSDPKRPNRGTHGFALLTFDDKNLSVSYINEAGDEDYSETI